MGHSSLDRGLALDERGGVLIEFLFILPMIFLLMTLGTYAARSKHTAVKTQSLARQCAWAHAMSGCEGDLPQECRAGGGVIVDALLRANAMGSFEQVVQDFFPSAVNLISLHGRTTSIRVEQEIKRPTVLGGTTTAEGRFTVACGDDPPHAWKTEEVFAAMCLLHGTWCF